MGGVQLAIVVVAVTGQEDFKEREELEGYHLPDLLTV